LIEPTSSCNFLDIRNIHQNRFNRTMLYNTVFYRVINLNWHIARAHNMGSQIQWYVYLCQKLVWLKTIVLEPCRHYNGYIYYRHVNTNHFSKYPFMFVCKKDIFFITINTDECCVRACVRACVSVCVRKCVRVSKMTHACICKY